MNGPEYYDWHGTPIQVEVHEGPSDVSILNPEHDTGEVPEGETHYLCMLPENLQCGWWATEDKFWKHSEPISPAAIERVGERDFVDTMKSRAGKSDRSQLIRCPGGGEGKCGSHRFAISILARVGPNDSIAICCAECGLPVLDADVNKAVDGVRSQIEEIYGG